MLVTAPAETVAAADAANPANCQVTVPSVIEVLKSDGPNDEVLLVPAAIQV